MRYFHNTDKEIAEKILEEGYSHRYHSPSTGWTDRFQNDSQWFCYYHLFLSFFSSSELEDIKKVLWNKELTENERGAFIKNYWSDRFGDNWSMLWVSQNQIFSGYGDSIIEFIPGPQDQLIEDEVDGYFVFIRLDSRFPASQFKFIGTFDESWLKGSNQDMESGLDLNQVKFKK